MASDYEKFLRSSIGSEGILSDYSSTISPRGDFTRLSGINVILSSWNTILSTPVRTVDHDPDFGSGIYRYVFEPIDDQTVQSIREEIISCLSRYDSRATIKSVNVYFLQDVKGFTVDITFSYNNRESCLSLTIDQQSYFNYNTSS